MIKLIIFLVNYEFNFRFTLILNPRFSLNFNEKKFVNLLKCLIFPRDSPLEMGCFRNSKGGAYDSFLESFWRSEELIPLL